MKSTSEKGQVLVTSLLFLVVFLGLSALVVDVGAWFVQRRQLQAGVDAAALAAAQALGDRGYAAGLARIYGDKNDLAAPAVSFSGPAAAPDTVTVSDSRTVNGFFSRVFGIDSVAVRAEAQARVRYLVALRGVPLAVSADHPALVCGLPCFEKATTIRAGKGGGELVPLSLTGRKNVKQKDFAAQLRDGSSISVGSYRVVKHDLLKKKRVRAAFASLIGSDLVLPVYGPFPTGGGGDDDDDDEKGCGDDDDDGDDDDKGRCRVKGSVDVVGWVAFTLTGFDLKGESRSLQGSFRRLIADEGTPGPHSVQPVYSAISLSLTK